jgi:glycerol dehydrogenase-like iron-containing ADH family enzyme
MTPRKQRLTVTVDPELVDAGNRAVASGAADSLSAWVGMALADKARRDQQLERLRDAIGDYEAQFGEITAEEIAAQRRADREDAVVVRGRKAGASKRARRARKARST